MKVLRIHPNISNNFGTPSFDMDRVTEKGKESSGGGASGGASPFSSDKDPLQYDPMLGWYTAATLSGLLVLFLACVGLEKIKDKIIEVCEGRDNSATATTTTTTKPFDALNTECIEIVVDRVKSLPRDKSSSGSAGCGGLTQTADEAGDKSEENVSLLTNTPRGSTVDNYVYMTLDKPNHLEVVRELEPSNLPFLERRAAASTAANSSSSGSGGGRASPDYRRRCSAADNMHIQKLQLGYMSDNTVQTGTGVIPPSGDCRRSSAATPPPSDCRRSSSTNSSFNIADTNPQLMTSQTVPVKDEMLGLCTSTASLAKTFLSASKDVVRDDNVNIEIIRVRPESPLPLRDHRVVFDADSIVDESSV